MAVERRVVLMYLLAVWCCADTPLVVRALLPISSVPSHGAEPAVSSGGRVMDALQAVISPEHHAHQDLSSPDRLKLPETSIKVNPVAVSHHPLADSVTTGEVCPCNSPKGPRMKEDDERWEECRNDESEKGSSLGGGGGRHDSVGIDVRESEGTGSADVEENCAVCLDKMEDEATLSTWDECGHQFHTACIQSLPICPLCRHPRTSGMPSPISPDNSLALDIPDNYPHAFIFTDSTPAMHFQFLFFHLTCSNSLCRLTTYTVWTMFTVLLALFVFNMLINAFCHHCNL